MTTPDGWEIELFILLLRTDSSLAPHPDKPRIAALAYGGAISDALDEDSFVRALVGFPWSVDWFLA